MVSFVNSKEKTNTHFGWLVAGVYVVDLIKLQNQRCSTCISFLLIPHAEKAGQFKAKCIVFFFFSLDNCTSILDITSQICAVLEYKHVFQRAEVIATIS